MTRSIAKNTFMWFVVALTLLALSTSTNASIDVSANVFPSTIPADGIVTSTLEICQTSQSVGSVTVIDDTLTTQQSTSVGYSVATQGTVTLTNSTWTAGLTVFVAPNGLSSGTVELNNSTWNVNSNMTIAKGSDSTAEITLNGGSLWTVKFATDFGDKGIATVTLNDGTWKPSSITIGGGEFYGHDGTGTVNLMADGVMDCQGSVSLKPNGTISLDGGLLSLVGENTFKGALTATSNGGTIRLDAGYAGGNFGRIDLSDDIDFTNCDLEIYFHDDYIPLPTTEFNLFDPRDTVDLAAALGNADSITTPAGWALDYETGIMTAVPEPSTVLLAAMALFTLATFWRKRG